MEPSNHLLTRLFEELRQRKVTRVALTYVAAAFAGLQGLELVLSPLGAERAYRWTVIAVLAGFPVALVLAWFFDLRSARVVRATKGAAPSPQMKSSRRWSRRRLVAVAALVLAGLGLYGYRTTRRSAGLPADAEVIAVAPFTAVGGQASALNEGLAQLMATDLDQVGGLRTVDPARVLRAWTRGDGERRSEAEALELARKLGAGSVLIGSAVAAGDEVRLISVLHSVSGREIARAQVTGPASDVLLLADSLSNRLLRAIWRSQSPIPQLRIAAITTSNLDAIRAYLDGERYYRELRWDSAIASLRRAVELDSTFALAHRRLADTYGWSGDLDSPLRAREEEAAVRSPERLPERERGVAVAFLLWHQKGDFRAALDSIDAHLRRYPDDAEALNLRGELLVHGAGPGGLDVSDSAALAAFEAALAADPDLVPAMIHPIALSARLGDSIRFRRYATRVIRSQVPDTVEADAIVDSVLDVLWERLVPSPGFMNRLLTDPTLRSIGLDASPLPTLILARRDPNPVADSILAAGIEGMDTLTLMIIGSSLVALGRVGDADGPLKALARASPQPAWEFRATAVAWGLAPLDFAPWPNPRDTALTQADSARLAPVRALFALSAGDTAAASRALAVAASAADRLPAPLEAMRRFQEGRLRTLRGDVPAGIQEMESAVRAAEAAQGSSTAPPPFFYRILLAERHSAYGPTRKQGIEELRRLDSMGPMFVPLVRIYLARALEAEGDRDAAKREYAVFELQTRRSEGPLAALHDEAQVALVRLTRER